MMNTIPQQIADLRKRAEIRRGIPRAERDRIADQLEKAANTIAALHGALLQIRDRPAWQMELLDRKIAHDVIQAVEAQP